MDNRIENQGEDLPELASSELASIGKLENSIWNFQDEKQELEHQASMLSLRFLSTIKHFMANQEPEIRKADLARMLNTSKSYITQLFTGDRLLNMKTLYKIEKVLGLEFHMSFGFRFREEGEEGYDPGEHEKPFVIGPPSSGYSMAMEKNHFIEDPDDDADE